MMLKKTNREMTRIALIEVDEGTESKPGFNEAREPLHLCYLKTMLLRKGYEAKVFQQLWKGDRFFLEQIAGYKPDVLAFTCVSSLYRKTKAFNEQLREKTGELSIIGGIHASMQPKSCVNDFDFVIRGEGEYTLPELLNSLRKTDTPKIKGVCYLDKKNEKIFDGGYADRIEDLDALGLPDREDLSMIQYNGAVPQPKIKGNFGSIVASRGCPYNCTFCTNKQFWRQKARVRSVKSILEELKLLKDKYDVKYVWFQDAELTVHKDLLKDLCKEMIKQKLDLYLYAMARVNDMLDKELVSLMKKAGFIQICMGVESGNQHILDKAKKGTKKAEIIKAFDNVYEEGIFPTALFIMGWPWETEKTLRESVELAKEIKALRVRYSNLYPFYGTDIRKYIDDKGLWLKEEYKDPFFASTETQVVKCEVGSRLLTNDILLKEIYGSEEFKLRLETFVKRLTDPVIIESLIEYSLIYLHDQLDEH